jgi:hypothetical protein
VVSLCGVCAATFGSPAAAPARSSICNASSRPTSARAEVTRYACAAGKAVSRTMALRLFPSAIFRPVRPSLSWRPSRSLRVPAPPRSPAGCSCRLGGRPTCRRPGPQCRSPHPAPATVAPPPGDRAALPRSSAGYCHHCAHGSPQDWATGRALPYTGSMVVRWVAWTTSWWWPTVPSRTHNDSTSGSDLVSTST